MGSERSLLLAFAINIVAVSVLAFVLYFPRHQRRDLVLAFLGVNVGLFAVAEFVADRELNLAVGLGLFALLSVVRLRSSEIAQEDIGYYFVALVLGLINGFSHDGELTRIVTLNVLLLVVMYVADHPRVLGRRFQQVVTLDDVYRDERALRNDVERLLGGTVTKMVVLRSDFVHKQTVVDVRLRSPVPAGPIIAPGRKHPHHGEPDVEGKPSQAVALVEPSPGSAESRGAVDPGDRQAGRGGAPA
jgi:Ca2+/Na+ antiporter